MFASGATLKALLIFLFAGLISGLFYDVLFIIKFITKHNILVVNVLDFLCVLCSGFLMIYCIFKFEFGDFAIFELISFLFGIVFEQIIVKNLWTSPIKWVYNKINLTRAEKVFLKNNNEKNKI